MTDGEKVKNAAEEHFVHFYSSEKKQKKQFTWKLYFHFVQHFLFLWASMGHKEVVNINESSDKVKAAAAVEASMKKKKIFHE